MAPGNWQATYNGFGFTQANGIGIINIEGLEDMADIRSGDAPRGRTAGMLRGLDIPAGRTFTLTGEIVAAPGLTIAQTVEQLQEVVYPQDDFEYVFDYLLPGTVTKRVYCRPRKRVIPVDIAYVAGIAEFKVQFYASDPRKYDANGFNAAIGLAVPSSGLTFNATPPFTFGGSTGGGGIIYADNFGNFITYPTATITGPVTNPRLQNNSTGETLALNITLGSSDYLEIDFDAHTVKLNGSAYRPASIVVGQWWGIDKGYTTNIGFYSSDASATGAALNLNWASAWI